MDLKVRIFHLIHRLIPDGVKLLMIEDLSYMVARRIRDGYVFRQRPLDIQLGAFFYVAATEFGYDHHDSAIVLSRIFKKTCSIASVPVDYDNQEQEIYINPNQPIN